MSWRKEKDRLRREQFCLLEGSEQSSIFVSDCLAKHGTTIAQLGIHSQSFYAAVSSLVILLTDMPVPNSHSLLSSPFSFIPRIRYKIKQYSRSHLNYPASPPIPQKGSISNIPLTDGGWIQGGQERVILDSLNGCGRMDGVGCCFQGWMGEEAGKGHEGETTQKHKDRSDE